MEPATLDGKDTVDTVWYQKRPVVVEAIQFTGTEESCAAVNAFVGADYATPDGGWITTLEGNMEFGPGDWIIRGVAGEFYPCKPQIFDVTYDVYIEDL